MFQAAVDRDPRFTQALQWLATTHLQINWLHLERDRRHIDRAKDAVDRLSALGADLPETHIARAWYTNQGLLDFPKAVEEFEAALMLQPSNTDAISGESYALRRLGRWEKAAELTAKWLELDPRNAQALWQHGLNCMFLGRYAEADRVFGLSASFSPLSGNTWARRAWLQVLWRGDVERARSILSEAGRVAGLEDDLDFVAWTSFRVELIRRDFQGALRQFESEKREALSSQFFFLPVDLLRGEVYALLGQQDLARRSYEAARRRLEELVLKNPDDASQYYSPLAIAYAGLGLREEALREAKRGVELDSADPWHALWRNEDLALVHAMLGQQDEAVDRLEFLLSQTGEVSTYVLRLDPRWDALTLNSRFQTLLAKYGEKR
jgi:tetratricopeptide (TPR) repeat protein